MQSRGTHEWEPQSPVRKPLVRRMYAVETSNQATPATTRQPRSRFTPETVVSGTPPERSTRIGCWNQSIQVAEGISSPVIKRITPRDGQARRDAGTGPKGDRGLEGDASFTDAGI